MFPFYALEMDKGDEDIIMFGWVWPSVFVNYILYLFWWITSNLTGKEFFMEIQMKI